VYVETNYSIRLYELIEEHIVYVETNYSIRLYELI